MILTRQTSCAKCGSAFEPRDSRQRYCVDCSRAGRTNRLRADVDGVQAASLAETKLCETCNMWLGGASFARQDSTECRRCIYTGEGRTTLVGQVPSGRDCPSCGVMRAPHEFNGAAICDWCQRHDAGMFPEVVK